MSKQYTYWIIVYGVVQGVGFRPFIKRLANELAVVGKVKNEKGCVQILTTGSKGQLSLFVDKIKKCPPYGAIIDHLEYKEIPFISMEDFLIIDSKEKMFEEDQLSMVQTKPFIQVGVDLPICPNCEKELYEKSNRRYRHPFISCVQCGPRYSIIKALPYDRFDTTMDCYPLCKKCEEEYSGWDKTGNPLRVHAQTISCMDCGPELLFYTEGTNETARREHALLNAISALEYGGVIAVKGIGGYHFVCKPGSSAAVDQLRQIKQRDRKPFAVMFRSMEQITSYCDVTPVEEQMLLSKERPIVLLKRRNTELVAENICKEVYKESLYLGAFLPYTAIQCLLLDACGPLVFTSGNITNEPILWEDKSVIDISSKLNGILYHTRPIYVSMDDSVVQIVAGRTQLIRRARGYVPSVISISDKEGEQFAAGGDLKAVFGYCRDGDAYLSQYIGDLEQVGNDKMYRWNRDHMKSLFQFQPKNFLVDYHEGYYSHKMTYEWIDEMDPGHSLTEPVKKVQHHHAHIASVMAEHKVHEVIGIAFDGTGLGEDKAVWGSEFLICSKQHYTRLGHLSYVSVVGYDNAAVNASVMAACHLHAAGITLDTPQFSLLSSAMDAKINTVACSSMGRLFDAVAAILNLCQYNSYEGECAIALETAAWQGNKEHIMHFPVEIVSLDGMYCVDQRNLIRILYQAVEDKKNVCDLALSFHYWVVDMTRHMCRLLREESGLNSVALSGGVFVNRILLENTIVQLETDGFQVLINEKVPCGDGGIALGQLYVGQW